jgi:AraC family transcriptional regulator, transcriptional activator of pobA
MKGIKNYEGIYGHIGHKPTTNFIFSELLETNSMLLGWKVEPHIHTNLCHISYIKTGQVQFHGLAQVVDLPIPCILVIPHLCLHGFTYTPDTTGHVLTLSDTIVEDLFDNLRAVATRFDVFQCFSMTDETHYLFDLVVALMKDIDEEIFADRPEKEGLIRAYLVQIFIVLHRIQIKEQVNKAIDNITLQHFRQFQKNLKNSEYPKNIPQFAEELGVSAVHLNRICQAVAEKPALQLVQEATIQKAQKYLTYTSYSISEIAYLLKFEDPSYFAKLFKKYTSLSPTEFRERQ